MSDYVPNPNFRALLTESYSIASKLDQLDEWKELVSALGGYVCRTRVPVPAPDSTPDHAKASGGLAPGASEPSIIEIREVKANPKVRAKLEKSESGYSRSVCPDCGCVMLSKNLWKHRNSNACPSYRGKLDGTIISTPSESVDNSKEDPTYGDAKTSTKDENPGDVCTRVNTSNMEKISTEYFDDFKKYCESCGVSEKTDQLGIDTVRIGKFLMWGGKLLFPEVTDENVIFEKRLSILSNTTVYVNFTEHLKKSIGIKNVGEWLRPIGNYLSYAIMLANQDRTVRSKTIRNLESTRKLLQDLKKGQTTKYRNNAKDRLVKDNYEKAGMWAAWDEVAVMLSDAEAVIFSDENLGALEREDLDYFRRKDNRWILKAMRMWIMLTTHVDCTAVRGGELQNLRKNIADKIMNAVGNEEVPIENSDFKTKNTRGVKTFHLSIEARKRWQLWWETIRPLVIKRAANPDLDCDMFFINDEGKKISRYALDIREFCERFSGKDGKKAFSLQSTIVRKMEATTVADMGATDEQKKVFSEMRAHCDATSNRFYVQMNAEKLSERHRDVRRAIGLGTVTGAGSQEKRRLPLDGAGDETVLQAMVKKRRRNPEDITSHFPVLGKNAATRTSSSSASSESNENGSSSQS